MTLIDDRAAKAADALQAEVFRAALREEREQVIRAITKRRTLMVNRAENRALHTQVGEGEVHLRKLDRMLARLDHRFPENGSS